MLFETLAVIVLILPISASSAWGLRNDFFKKWYILILALGPIIDAWIIWYLLNWLELGFVATWGCTISAGLISCVFLQPLLSPRRLVVFRLSWQQVKRRPRQAALMMAGLLIASSIITSSLVVGDSLDATLSKEVESVYGDTDLLIYQKDRRTGFSYDMDLNLTTLFGQSLLASGLADQWSHGLDTTATLSRADGQAIPSAGWYAYSGWEGVAINQVASDELELVAGDLVEVSWYSYSDDAELIRTSENVTIGSVIEMEGRGAMSGTNSPAIFTSLELSQQLQSKSWKVNMLRVSMFEDLGASEHIPDVKLLFNQLIDYESAGFDINADGDAISISNGVGLGRLDSTFMESWNENSTMLLDGGTAMEVLQIPLKQIEQSAKIMTLPDDRVDEILITDEGDWYVSGGAVSFQIDRGGSSHGWEVPNGGLINDVTLLSDSLLVAHSDGLSEIPNDRDEDLIHHSEGEEVLIAAFLPQGLPDLPSTIFSMDYLNNSGEDWIAVKHLTGNEVHRYVGEEWVEFAISGEWLAFDEEVLIGTPNNWITSTGISSPLGLDAMKGGLLADNESLYKFNGQVNLLSNYDSICDKRVFAHDGEVLCSTAFGVMVDDGELSPRLPVTVDIGGFGIMPQLLLATDGALSPAKGDILISSRLSYLNSSENVLLNGLVPWAYGDQLPLTLEIEGNMSSIDAPGLEELESIIIGFVNLSDGEELAAASDGERSILVINGGNQTSVVIWLNNVSGVDSMNLKIVAAKEEALAAASEGAGALSAMFLVFGAFTIGAGILLVLTIVMMLADSRRSDEAIIRAIGLKRSDMRSLSLMEGMMTSSAASILGGVFGLFLAWLISLAFNSVFASAGVDGVSFSFSYDSMLIGASYGFLIAMVTLWLTAFWTSRLNIVQALRNLSPMRSRGIPWWLMLLLIVFIGGGMLSGLTILTIDSSSSLRFALWHIMASMMIIGLVPVFTYVLPHVMGWPIRNTGRNTMATMGICLFLWALSPDSWAPVDTGIQPDEITFAVLGMVQVFAGVMVLSGLAPRVASWLMARSIFTKRFGPVVKVSLAHPSASPMKTAVIMGMFSLTVFSVIVLAGYSVQFQEHSAGYVEDASGDFEVLLSSSRQVPLELSSNPDEWGLKETSPSDIDAVGRVNRAVVWVDDGDEKIGYILRGVDSGFTEHGGIPLEDWDRSLGGTQDEAWDSLNSNPNVVFVDSSFALIDPNTGESLVGITIPIGKSISLIDITNPGNSRNVTVGGILSESSQLFSQGIWMNGEIVEEQYGGVVTRIYVSHDADSNSVELEESLSNDLASKGVYSSVIEEEILLILGLVYAILSIFQAYLALGLIVGIAGIGVVTYRSVSERSGEIGMLRALGFRKNMVMGGMILEVSWTSLLGMLNGAVVAMMFHLALYRTFWEDQGVDLILPWVEVLTIVIGGWILVLIATWMPVSKATKVTPSQALSSLD
ncbi:ABC transporter permease [Candidatus Poseidoniaceae archaeon]|nr:ABC transporter permease [Candidatus Poseidoniaceae archaeon]